MLEMVANIGVNQFFAPIDPTFQEREDLNLSVAGFIKFFMQNRVYIISREGYFSIFLEWKCHFSHVYY